MSLYKEVLREKLEGGLKQSVEKIHRMYEDAIVPFENTDDEYKKKLGSYYDEWASVGDKFADGWHVVKNAGLGVWDGLTDLVLGILKLLKGVGEVVLWLALQNPVTSYFGIMPEFLEEDMGEMWSGVKQLLKDPGNIVEAIGQSTFDTVDEKGAAGDVAQYTDEVAEAASKVGKHADEVAEATKAAAGKAVSESGAYSGDLMSAEEAARYSEHWRELGIGSDKTYNDFIMNNSGKNIDDYFRLVKEQSPWPDGYMPSEHMVTLKSGDTFNMVLDSKQKTSNPGGFALKEDVPSVEFARKDMAIKYGWKDDCGKVVTYRVKDGVELICPDGPIGPQIDLGVDMYLPGNSSLTQYDLFNGLGRINRTDFIEVVSGSIKRIK